jgi:hypothetical protein
MSDPYNGAIKEFIDNIKQVPKSENFYGPANVSLRNGKIDLVYKNISGTYSRRVGRVSLSSSDGRRSVSQLNRVKDQCQTIAKQSGIVVLPNSKM